MKRIRLIFITLFPLVIGMISAAISSQGMAAYGSMSKPPLSPPSWVFSVAWTLLYLMMGLASCLILTSQVERREKIKALLPYSTQLVMNFFWSIIFFNWNMYLFALLWLLILWCLVILSSLRFFEIRRIAGYLMIPYVFWLAFAAYLNFGTVILHY